MSYPEEQLANALGLSTLNETLSYADQLEVKQRELERSLSTLESAVDIAQRADVQLDLAEALERVARELREQYSTVKFRYTGTVGEPGRVRE